MADNAETTTTTPTASAVNANAENATVAATSLAAPASGDTNANETANAASVDSNASAANATAAAQAPAQPQQPPQPPQPAAQQPVPHFPNIVNIELGVNPFLNNNLRNGQNNLMNARDRLFHAIYFKVALMYAHLVPKPIQCALEYLILLKAFLCFFVLVYIHLTFIKHPATCLSHIKDWPKDGVLRVEIVHNLDKQRELLSQTKYTEQLVKDLQKHYYYGFGPQTALNTKRLKEYERRLAKTGYKLRSTVGYSNQTMIYYFTQEAISTDANVAAAAKVVDEDEEEQYIVEYSLEYGHLRLTPNTRKRLHIPVRVVQLDPLTNKCFGDDFSKFLLKKLLGYDDILMASVRVIAEQEENKGYLRNVITGEHYRFVSLWWAAWSSYPTAFIVMLLFTLTVSMLLRFSHQQIFIFIVDLLQMLEFNATARFPIAPLLTIILALVGMESIMSEFFNDTTTAFYIILIVWVADQYDAICCHTSITKRHWLRFFYLYHFVFYAYHYRFSGQNRSLALACSWFFIQHSMFFFFHHYELPVILQQAQILLLARNQNQPGNPQLPNASRRLAPHAEFLNRLLQRMPRQVRGRLRLDAYVQNVAQQRQQQQQQQAAQQQLGQQQQQPVNVESIVSLRNMLEHLQMPLPGQQQQRQQQPALRQWHFVATEQDRRQRPAQGQQQQQQPQQQQQQRVQVGAIGNINQLLPTQGFLQRALNFAGLRRRPMEVHLQIRNLRVIARTANAVQATNATAATVANESAAAAENATNTSNNVTTAAGQSNAATTLTTTYVATGAAATAAVPATTVATATAATEENAAELCQQKQQEANEEKQSTAVCTSANAVENNALKSLAAMCATDSTEATTSSTVLTTETATVTVHKNNNTNTNSCNIKSKLAVDNNLQQLQQHELYKVEATKQQQPTVTTTEAAIVDAAVANPEQDKQQELEQLMVTLAKAVTNAANVVGSHSPQKQQRQTQNHNQNQNDQQQQNLLLSASQPTTAIMGFEQQQQQQLSDQQNFDLIDCNSSSNNSTTKDNNSTLLATEPNSFGKLELADDADNTLNSQNILNA